MYKYESIAEQIRENIQSKTLLPNQQLPSLREMADAFSTSVGTVKEAYDYLERENFIYSVPKRGFFVLGGKLLPTSSQMLVDFYSGAPDIRYIPYQDFKKCINKATNLYYKRLFSYSDTKGIPELISALQRHLMEYQIYTKKENIVVVSGSQQVLDILCRMPFPNGKQTVLVEQPAYYGMIKNLEITQTPRVGIMRGPGGIDFDELGKQFQYGNIKFFIQYPDIIIRQGKAIRKRRERSLCAWQINIMYILLRMI